VSDERPGCLALLAAMGVLVVGVVYLLNPTFGFLELIPDNTPLIGNLDEAGATAAVIYALRTLWLGWRRPRRTGGRLKSS